VRYLAILFYIVIRCKMAMVEDFTQNQDLRALLREAGFKAAVDVALIDLDMAVEFCVSSPDLQEELLEIAARARPSIHGWARSVSVFGGSGGGGRAEGTVQLEIKSGSSASGLSHGGRRAREW